MYESNILRHLIEILLIFKTCENILLTLKIVKILSGYKQKQIIKDDKGA